MKSFVLLTLRLIALGLLVISCNTPATPTSNPGLETPISIQASFTYSMEDRFGIDADRNNIPDLPNTIEYVQNSGRFKSRSCLKAESASPTFAVTFDADASDILAKPVQTEEYIWEISSKAIPFVTFEGQKNCIYLPEGTFDVTLTVVSGDSRNSVTEEITVEDLLFVSIGDSYSSGEGNPERIKEWANPGFYNPGVARDHIIAHRSTLAWPAQAALALERADPHTSVTFVSVAATGATIAKGLLGEHSGAKLLEGYDYLPDMDPQLEQVARLVIDRQIDVLTISIGGNDIGFSKLIAALMLKGASVSAGNIEFRDIEDALESGDWKILEGASLLARMGGDWPNVTGFKYLWSRYRDLDLAIRRDLPNVYKIYIMEYPDPTSWIDNDGDLAWCPQIMAHMDAKLEAIQATIDQGEARFAFDKALIPLNATIRSAAKEHGWIYVGGVANAFGNGGHGYCAEPPYLPRDYSGNPFPDLLPFPIPAGMTWFRTAGASVTIQGPDNPIDTIGTMHPNEFGHRAMSEYLLAYLDLPVDIPGVGSGIDPNPRRADRQTSEAEQSGSRFNIGFKPFSFDYGLLPVEVGVSGSFWGVDVETGTVFSLTGVPLGPYFEVGNDTLSFAGKPLGPTLGTPPQGSVTVVGVTALFDPRTGGMLAIQTGDSWIDLAGNLIIGNPIAAVTSLLSNPDDRPVQRDGYLTTEMISDDLVVCFFRNLQVAQAHQAELDMNYAWLEAHGYIKTDHHYSTDPCYPLHEWEPSNADSDGDGLLDYSELQIGGLDPYNPDTDGDGLLDGYEPEIGTWPMNADSDRDGVPDKTEDDWWKSLTPDQQNSEVEHTGCRSSRWSFILGKYVPPNAAACGWVMAPSP
ncbi:MAG TPA: hypothetical protein VK206_13030 [Anaerolineales bacterium]|nr:hypothetical protein [Anaerolineales bacterium]